MSTEEKNQWQDQLEDIVDTGEIAYSLFWDTGGPGGGAGLETIYKYAGLYFGYTSDLELQGPFDSFEGALTDYFTFVTNAVESITCTSMSAKDLVPRLQYGSDIEHTLTINGERWKVTASGEFRRVE
jgi:hypothetical protein